MNPLFRKWEEPGRKKRQPHRPLQHELFARNPVYRREWARRFLRQHDLMDKGTPRAANP